MAIRSRVSLRSLADLLVADLVEIDYSESDQCWYVYTYRSGRPAPLNDGKGKMAFKTLSAAEYLVRKHFAGTVSYPWNRGVMPEAE